MSIVFPERVRCSDLARGRGDDNAATAARTDVWLLVELPITWGRDPLYDAAMPFAVRDALLRARGSIARSRVVFIRKRVECLGASRVYVVRSAPRLSVVSLDLTSIEEVAQVDFAALAARTVMPERPLVLVCTHGQHDSCCGRRGYPLFDALQRRADLDVWQCSHIGGDRFAANAVVLPWGLYYGPVEAADANVLADAIVRNEILLPAYRGRSTLARPIQFAETFVRKQLGLTPLDAVQMVSRETRPDGRFRIHLRDTSGGLHDVLVEQYTAVDAAKLTCLAKEPNPVLQFRVVAYGTST